MKSLILAGADCNFADRCCRTVLMMLCSQPPYPSYPNSVQSRRREQARTELITLVVEALSKIANTSTSTAGIYRKGIVGKLHLK